VGACALNLMRFIAPVDVHAYCVLLENHIDHDDRASSRWDQPYQAKEPDHARKRLRVLGSLGSIITHRTHEKLAQRIEHHQSIRLLK